MIESINAYTQINQSPAASKTASSENADMFKQLLGNAVQSKKGTTQEAGSDTEITSSGALSEISSIKNIELDNPLSEIERKTDELIERMSLYSNLLENQEVSLKDIDGLLQEINANAGDLLKETLDSEDADQSLMNIVRECAITAHSEYIKFQRGDYLEGFA
ncbi:MAG: hypothetical protein HQK65_04815 [Desulfamplus sp.]|nr:hypothetical protein [Desulfamplus sp.]